MVFRIMKLLLVLVVLPFVGGCLAAPLVAGAVAGKVAAKQTDQYIALDTKPSGAAASITDEDGESVASCDSTPCTVVLHAGMRHPLEVTFSKEGCQDAALTLDLLKSQRSGLSKAFIPAAEVIAPNPASASLNCE